MKHVLIKDIDVGNDLPFTLIAGPCQIESRSHALMMAKEIKKITDELNIKFIFKSSFDKANRSSIDSKRGLGLKKSLDVFDEIRHSLNVPVLTDIHEKDQCEKLFHHVDVLQIPAFLCRQTDLLVEAGSTGAVVNIKKGQFLAPWDMENVTKKVSSTGNERILLTERGASFGYNNLISDMRSLSIMAKTGYPVIMDATHSVQLPGGNGNSSGGQREFVPIIARAAIAVGIAGVFMEVHDDPDNAASDGPNSLRLDDLSNLLSELKKIDQIRKAIN